MIMKNLTPSVARNLLLLSLIVFSGILMSPKWSLVIAPWVYFTALLYYVRHNNWKGIMMVIPFLILSSFVAQTKVMPMPYMAVLFMMTIGSIVGLIPLLLEKLFFNNLPKWSRTLAFPILMTGFNYIFDMGPQGTWGNTAYTQFSWLSLMQLASITGIYGINFIIYWGASTGVEWINSYNSLEKRTSMHYIMPIVLTVVVLTGYARLNSGESDEAYTKSRMASITLDNLSISKAMYKATYDKDINVPWRLNQSDPILQEAQKGILAFMSDPEASKYDIVYKEIDHVFNRYIEATRTAATRGAKVVTWSEAAIINTKKNETKYEDIVSNLADSLDTYIFYPTAVFHPEKVGKEAEFIENKVLTYGPDGSLLNTYYKNIPVMGVEPSFPGDGNIPVIKTPYGNLSPIICYDADHPDLIAQVQNKETDVLVVPTGDWDAISPYHTQMAAVRCIENGVSMIKSTSNGLSAMIDDKGRLLKTLDYFTTTGSRILVHDMKINKTHTFYSVCQPLFIKGLGYGFLICLLYVLFKGIFRRRFKHQQEITPQLHVS